MSTLLKIVTYITNVYVIKFARKKLNQMTEEQGDQIIELLEIMNGKLDSISLDMNTVASNSDNIKSPVHDLDDVIREIIDLKTTIS